MSRLSMRLGNAAKKMEAMSLPDERPSAPLPWRVLGSRQLHADQWISLRADHCITTEGVEVAPSYVLDYPDWVHIVGVNATNEILLVQQYRHGAAAVTLELPAGRVDASDSSPEEAARRELLEETGCTAQDLKLVNRSSPNPASHSNSVFSVLATGVQESQVPKDESARTSGLPLGSA